MSSKNSLLRAYEMMVIINTSLEDQAIGDKVDDISKSIGDRGGEVRNVDRWGRRPFAYEINHQREGYYVVYEFVGGEGLDRLERTLHLADEVVRHKLVRLPDGEAARRGLLEPAAS